MTSHFFRVRGSRRSELTHQDRAMLKAVGELNRCMLCGVHENQVCHSDQITDGKAFGMKSHPVIVAAMCAKCHIENGHGRDDKEKAFRDFDLAYKRTIAALYDAGKLVVKP